MIQKLRDFMLMATAMNILLPGIQCRVIAGDKLNEQDADSISITFSAPVDIAPTAPLSTAAAP